MLDNQCWERKFNQIFKVRTTNITKERQHILLVQQVTSVDKEINCWLNMCVSCKKESINLYCLGERGEGEGEGAAAGAAQGGGQAGGGEDTAQD